MPGTLESLGPIVRYVLEAAGTAGLDRRASYRLRLAVDELATNIVNHGYKESGRAGAVLVRAELDQQWLTIVLEDAGVPFDPRSLARPSQIDLPLEDRPIGGLGVYLAIQGVDEFRYEYVDSRNRNILRMRRASV